MKVCGFSLACLDNAFSNLQCHIVLLKETTGNNVTMKDCKVLQNHVKEISPIRESTKKQETDFKGVFTNRM